MSANFLNNIQLCKLVLCSVLIDSLDLIFQVHHTFQGDHYILLFNFDYGFWNWLWMCRSCSDVWNVLKMSNKVYKDSPMATWVDSVPYEALVSYTLHQISAGIIIQKVCTLCNFTHNRMHTGTDTHIYIYIFIPSWSLLNDSHGDN